MVMSDDTYLLNKISSSLKDICEVNNIRVLKEFDLVINQNSNINEKTLCEYLENHNSSMVDPELKINIKQDDIEELTAIIYSLQGE